MTVWEIPIVTRERSASPLGPDTAASAKHD